MTGTTKHPSSCQNCFPLRILWMKRRMAGVANPKLLQNLQKKRNSDPFFCLRMRLIQMNISSWLLMTASTSQPTKMTAFVSQKEHLNFVHFSNCGHRESNDKKRPGPSSQPQFRAGRRNIRAPRSPPPHQEPETLSTQSFLVGRT